MITTQLLPAAGLLPFVFTRSCEVKEVGESCRYVWLAVWISGIRYPEVFTTLPARRNRRREKNSGKITARHLNWGLRVRQPTLAVREQVSVPVSSECFPYLHDGLDTLLGQSHKPKQLKVTGSTTLSVNISFSVQKPTERLFLRS